MEQATSTKENVKAMAFSVGGSPQPVIYSVNRLKPDYIYLFCSQSTNMESVPQIISSLDYEFDKNRIFVEIVDDPQDLLSCYKSADNMLCNIFAQDINRDEILVDYTGGTKNMTAALVLASAKFGIDYVYIGGKERTKDGLGIVVDGKEEFRGSINPWIFFAVDEKRKIADMFNHYQYASAVLHIDTIISKVEGRIKLLYKNLRDIIVGFDLWDHFKYEEASKCLSKERLETVANICELLEESSLLTFTRECSQTVKKLYNIVTKIDNMAKMPGCYPDKKFKIDEIMYDVLSNADRRAQQGQYDDAILRLYRSMEMAGQIELDKYEINDENVDVNNPKLTPDAKGWLLEKFKDNNKIQLPLFNKFELLSILGNQVGIKFVSQLEDIRKVLSQRNNSFLAHGFCVLEEKHYKKFRDTLFSFLAQHTEKRLTTFPKMII